MLDFKILNELEGEELHRYLKKNVGRAERILLLIREVKKKGYINISEMEKKYGYATNTTKKDVQLLHKHGYVKLDENKLRYEATGILKLKSYLNKLVKAVSLW